MLTGDGLVKVLDFGLAKLAEAISFDAWATPTLTLHSQEATIAGTAAYMSPEQAEGKPVDPRSDIFSFGAVLYEMVTGRRAFIGDSVPSTLAAVIKDQPRPPGELALGLPRDFEKLILRCLHKDPGRRWQRMTDLRVALREVQGESDSQPPGTRKPTPRWRLAALVALPLVIGGGWLIWQRGNRPGAPPRVVQLTSYKGFEMYPSFSPDGNQVAFTWDGPKGDNLDVYVKMVGEENALRLTTDPARDLWPAWSPDGKRIAFLRSATDRETAIYVVSPLGGAEQKLAEFPGSGQISWSPDGKWLAVARAREATGFAGLTDGIFRLPVEGGEPKRITNPKTPAFDTSPAFSPTGRLLAYSSCSRAFSCDLYVQGTGFR